MQVGQFLNLEVSFFDAGKMAFPDERRVAGFGKLPGLKRQGPIPAPGVGADDMHALVENPKRGLTAESAAVRQIFRTAPERRRAALGQKDIPFVKRMTDAVQPDPDIVNGNIVDSAPTARSSRFSVSSSSIRP